MSLNCGGCGARIFEGADWCTQCFTPASEALETPTSVPAAITVPEPVAVAAPAPAPAPPTAPPAPRARTNWWDETPAETATWTPSRAAASAATATVPGLPLPQAPARVDASVVRLGVALVVLGLVSSIGVSVWASSGAMEPVEALKVGLWAVVGIYTVVMAAVVAKARTVDFQPVWTRGDGVESLLVGLLTGGGAALGLLLLSRLLTGEVQGDSGIAVIVSEGTLIRYAAAFFVACVAAPWVEELLFRGLLAESMAAWGERKAAFVSALLFAAWHPQAVAPLFSGNTGPLKYYVVCGLVLARVYHRRGLKASIAAHTAFNGLLVVTAIVVAVGPAHVIEANGVSLTAPGSWREVSADQAEGELAEAGVAEMVDLIVQGPSGSGLIVMHVPLPAGAPSDPEAVLANMAEQFGTTGTAERVDYPMGPAVRTQTEARGHEVVAVAVAREHQVWMIMLVPGGSAKAKAEFEDILETVALP